jgi:chromosome segregation ATPase
MTTQAGREARAAALRAARTKDSQLKRRRALDAVHALEAADTPVTAAAVASAAGVSTWLVYADGIREHIQAAQRRQAERADTPQPASTVERPRATPASLRTDLAVAQQEIRRLRAERDQLRNRLRLHLGGEIEGPDRAELITRVATLETVNRQLAAERDARTTEADHAHQRIRELDDELTAARESLRRVIRSTNR